ncbi:Aldo/keto reductase, partial [Aureobasidium melanogenum]
MFLQLAHYIRYTLYGIHEVSLQALLSNRSSRPTSLNINLTSRPPLTSLSHQIPLINDPPIGSTGNRKSTVFRSRTPSPGLSSSKTAMVPPEANPRSDDAYGCCRSRWRDKQIPALCRLDRRVSVAYHDRDGRTDQCPSLRDILAVATDYVSSDVGEVCIVDRGDESVRTQGKDDEDEIDEREGAMMAVSYIINTQSSTKLRELLVIAEEDLDGQPGVAADLEAVGTAAELLHLVVGQRPAVKLEVALDSRSGDGLRNDRGAALETPHETGFSTLAWIQVGGRKLAKLTGPEQWTCPCSRQSSSGPRRGQEEIVDELGGGVVGEDLEVLDGKVGDTDVLDAARGRQLLKLSPKMNCLPGVNEVPVGVQIDVVGLEVLERRGNALLDALVPGVVKLGGNPDVLAGNAGVLDTKTDLVLVAVGKSSVNVTVAGEESSLDGLANLVGLGLPGTETDGGDLSTLYFVNSRYFTQGVVCGILFRCLSTTFRMYLPAITAPHHPTFRHGI